MEVVLKLATRPGVPSETNIIYTEDTFNKMIESENTKNLIASNKLYVTKKSPDLSLGYDIDSDNIVGYVKEWNGVEVTVELVGDYYKELIQEIARENFELGMNYTCMFRKFHEKIEVVGMRIHCLTLVYRLNGKEYGE